MKKRSILIVDDDALYLQLVKSIVENAGAKARYASSGEEAVAMLKEGGIATMITDLNMRGMDGFELAMLAKELSPDIDIVMITGDISPDITSLAAKAGISRVLAKPCGAEEIREIVSGRQRGGWAMNGKGSFE
jgi:DNA-binding NtrC family response regulator